MKCAMTRYLINLLATDQLTRRIGAGGLNPRLRAALEADLRFPARAASPQPTVPLADADLPESIQRLVPRPADREQKQATGR